MKTRWLPFATAAFLLCLSVGASALQTTWEIKGHLTTVTGPFASQFHVGDAFRILVNFDTDEPLAQTRSGVLSGKRYAYAAETMTYRIEIGTACAPCEPANDPGFNPSQSSILVRDDFADSGPALDGFTFGLTTGDGVFINLLMRGPVTDIVNGPGLPALPDQRLAGLETHVLQICPTTGNSCDDAEMDGAIESVATPTFGTTYSLTARDCLYIDSTTTSGDSSPRDCVYVNAQGVVRGSYGRKINLGGGLGLGEFSQSANFTSDWTGPNASLGAAFGAITFGGPSGLPVLKASAFPTDIGRLNANLLGFQRYTYIGAPTSLPLVVALTYGVADFSADPAASTEIGLRPGGASVGATLAIIDGSIPMPSVAGNINTLECGAEPGLLLPDGSPWPAGSILGSASSDSPAGQNTPSASATLVVHSCANPAVPVQLAANQSFIVATSMQAPARGKWSVGAQAAGNGYVDASHTVRVTFDPSAPPALVQQLADSIAPQCTDCFVAEVAAVAVDVTPGVSDCINPKSNGVIPVAILGSAAFKVKDVRQDDSLKLGALGSRVRNGKTKCSTLDLNGDGYPDLVCNFDNAASNWTRGQVQVAVTGKLYNGLPFSGSDSICIK